MLASLHSKEEGADPARGQPPVACQTQMPFISSGHTRGHGGLCVPTGYELEISITLAILVDIRGHESSRLS